ncbi:glycosyltransferase [Lawsonibacter sp. LCP25S3_G6]|uniref:glycosyltransferase n=1 Tax=unclassified Lawsonibacter TaxID=2617946 RepID=UPI003F99B660
MKVAILTMFSGLSTTYSLVNVVADQIKMLLEAQVEVKILVCETCPDEERWGIFRDPRLEWVKITNTCGGVPIVWHDYSSPTGTVHEGFYQEAETIARDYVRNLQDVDVCILHDILYQGWHLVHNVAIRRAQTSLPNVRFLAFTHSLPVNRPQKMEEPFSARFTPMPNTCFVYPSRSGIEALARQYDVPQGNCAVVYNSLPLLEVLSEDVQRVAGSIDLLHGEILAVCPGRLTPGKRFEKAAALAGAIQRKTEQRTQMVFCDFPCADIPSRVYKEMIQMEGRKFGLEEGDMVFTSDLGYEQGFPRKGVLELFGLSNLFICPSYSESFGLTVLEAASRGNFLVLNEAVPALKELGESLGAYFMRWDGRNFGYDTHERYVPSEQAYYEEHGGIIVNLMREDRSLRAKTRARTQYNGAWICRNQLMPLLRGN